MQEESTIPTVRAMKNQPLNRNSRGIHGDSQREPTKDATSSRTYVDVLCSYCGAYGHKGIRCDKMAQHLHLQTAVQTLVKQLNLKYFKIMSKSFRIAELAV
jgi:hypothetical protein